VSAAPDRLAAALADRYTIERELGAGGMATVYLAQDLKHDRKVALKVLRPELLFHAPAESGNLQCRVAAQLAVVVRGGGRRAVTGATGAKGT